MNSVPTIISYQNTFSKWAGCKVKLVDDFETYCDCDYDFIELLLVFENAFSLNLFESSAERKDFQKLEDFLSWTMSQSKATGSFIPFRFQEPEVIPIMG